MDLENVPKGRKLIGNRWGTFRVCLVALGYSQVAGIDFSDHFSPVLCNASLRIIRLMIQRLKLLAWSLEIETAFFNGDLVQENYMKVPKEYMEVHGPGKVEGKATQLQKSMYGLFQAARQWHKKFEEVILKQGFTRNEIDPCAF
jgi:Reverse transcriptase (RNA-dependent DNA polymerase)